jgi:hypothetical protein
VFGELREKMKLVRYDEACRAIAKAIRELTNGVAGAE